MFNVQVMIGGRGREEAIAWALLSKNKVVVVNQSYDQFKAA